VKKDLEYYMKLPYTIEVVPIPESQGGGFTARLPQVGRLAITGDGETPEEAIGSLEEAKQERFAEYLEKGIAIPEPEPEKEEYSGRFVVRMTGVLHRQLAGAAKREQVSLNQFVNYLLVTNFHLDRQQKQFETIVDDLTVMREAIWDFPYSYLPKQQLEDQGLEEELEEHEDQATEPMLRAA
jgi:antitoxin HicB